MPSRIVVNSAAIRALTSQPEVVRALHAAASKAVTTARALAPVRTGKLRDSITYQIVTDQRGTYAKIGFGVNAYYGEYVETGTRKMRAQPFLRPSVGGGKLRRG